MVALVQHRLTADAFIEWALERRDGKRYELVAGEVFEMSPERSYHARTKLRVARQIEDAAAAAGITCEVYPDGMAVRIDEYTVYEPDCAMRLGAPLDPAAMVYDDPVVVVEVLSPSTRALDAGAKLAGYFSLPSVRHYMLVRLDSPMVIHHERLGDGTIQTRIVGEGTLRLDPPGLELQVADLFP